MFEHIDLIRAVDNQYHDYYELALINYHSDGWKARNKSTGDYSPLSMSKAVNEQYDNHIATLTGIHAYDWKALSLDAIKYKVVPVLIIPKDLNLANNITKVGAAIDNFKTLMKKSKQWLEESASLTFDHIAPIVLIDNDDSGRWTYRSNLAGESNAEDSPEDRFSYFWSVANRIKQSLPTTEEYHYVGIVYCGHRTDITQGNANSGNISGLCPSTVVLNYNEDINKMWHKKLDLLSSAVHEMIGHSGGLPHPKEHTQQFNDSIMGHGKLTTGKFYPDEIALLKKSNFLKEI